MKSTPKAETETVIRWDLEDKDVHIWSNNPAVLRRLARLGGAHAGRPWVLPDSPNEVSVGPETGGCARSATPQKAFYGRFGPGYTGRGTMISLDPLYPHVRGRDRRSWCHTAAPAAPGIGGP